LALQGLLLARVVARVLGLVGRVRLGSARLVVTASLRLRMLLGVVVVGVLGLVAGLGVLGLGEVGGEPRLVSEGLEGGGRLLLSRPWCW
jgi:hypothetical protein